MQKVRDDAIMSCGKNGGATCHRYEISNYVPIFGVLCAACRRTTLCLVRRRTDLDLEEERGEPPDEQ